MPSPQYFIAHACFDCRKSFKVAPRSNCSASSYRSASGPPLPDKLADVEAFIRDNPAHPLRVAAPNNSFKPSPHQGGA